MMSRNVPKLRFKGFEDEWEKIHLSDRVERVVRKNKGNVTNRPLTISAQYGLVNQEEFFNKVVASKNLEGYYLLNNGEFAYNKSYSNGYPFGAIKRLDKYKNGAVSTLYICFKPKLNVDSDFLTQYFESSKWYREVSMVAVEGARNHGLLNIGVSDFFDTIHRFPSLQEQEKIANFLSKVDSIIEKQEKKVQYWNSYKKGMIQKIFSQKIRFQDGNKKSYTDWEEVRLSYILTETNNKNTGDLRVCSVSVRKGVIDQIEHLGRSFAAKDTSKYKLVKKGDLIYTKSPTGEFPYGIIKQSFLEENVVVSPLYGVFKPKNYYLGYILHSYFYYKENTNNYLYSIVQKGAKNTINISNEVFLSKKLNLPTSTDEQIKIFNLLLSIDNIIDKENKKLEELKQWKKGLLQQMFV
ncbi:restriction endonuclease subunit S [Clostridium perfringens]|uniref:restriction endonuclease subunit S n=1 Tax=Clostridium perfringens TaxID=1502 RepID=UPI001FAC8EE3|nr:restriction endonuclease subunit S [Clostridium perfringens]